jgi:hypothetical protein
MTTEFEIPEMALEMIAAKDVYGFLHKSESNWDTHRPLLWLGINLTEGPIIEMGSGYGSTPLLRKHCAHDDREFLSFDSNKEWAEKMNSCWIPPSNWMYYESSWGAPCGLLFVDHAPGEHRWQAISKASDKADIIVFHDSEIGGAGNYQYDRILPLFQYQLHYNRHGGGAGASMVSNKIDVSKFKGLKLGQFQFDND